MQNYSSQTKGSTLLEAILALSIIGLMVVVFVGTITYARQGSTIAANHTKALLVAEEGLEAVRNIRDTDFALLTDGPHGLSLVGGVWGFDGESDIVGQVTRTITVQPLNVDTKQIISSVTWMNGPNASSLSLSTFLTDWRR